MKKYILLISCFLSLSCFDQRNTPIEKAKTSVMTEADIDDYSFVLHNNLDKDDNYFELMPYALKMQKQGLGHYDFFNSYLRIVFNGKFDSRNIMKIEKFEQDYLIKLLQKGAMANDHNCKEQLVEYYKNGWGVARNVKKADSIYATFKYPAKSETH